MLYHQSTTASDSAVDLPASSRSSAFTSRSVSNTRFAEIALLPELLSPELLPPPEPVDAVETPSNEYWEIPISSLDGTFSPFVTLNLTEVALNPSAYTVSL